MPYVIHHNDHDGKCSAAIVMNELLPVFVKDQIVCIEYNYGYNVNWDEVLNPEKFLPNGKEICYIVDVALNDTIFNVIKMLVENNVQVVHIDHHQGTLDYLGKDGVSDILSSENVIQFYRMDISATMLCWVYSCMTEEERQRPMEIEFDFTPTYSHVMINLNDKGKARMKTILSDIILDNFAVFIIVGQTNLRKIGLPDSAVPRKSAVRVGFKKTGINKIFAVIQNFCVRARKLFRFVSVADIGKNAAW